MSKRNVCVFGATGGIGAALVAALAERDEVACIHAGGRRLPEAGAKVRPFAFDLLDESSIVEAAAGMAEAPPDLIVVATGALAFKDGSGPEKSYRGIDAARMSEMMAVNAIGPALVAKHVLPLLPRDRRAVFAILSARVGSIADNRLGGWHSYRASKAALNMLIRNFAIELRRTHPQTIVVALHPGTVDTPLSRAFQRNLPEGQLTASHEAATNLLGVINGLTPADTGAFLAWDGQRIPF
ncbi:NAD(P)-dependent dehydrogenase (short-subunit alcohol dehydrogenase family) [Novosphingobium chloroacetimidivorans]|uniref:NAD(P)-dependent dehydrogenase (Short-subunit alcohol dehydrogenase family) n=1 Tax=Novosphingobium chloroacetimidivorans TaxID=1428314 RepID=A0A7W7NVP9_9SPHN|nr:SDR family NAD(P)-dependent oxidoreductase [Novosphingobium chloroacetimidivorans]MBB4858531.1 NAD(P)-dependent dehydrogenase (short-subunit alcohol dehydrogenase family) [Novosphingobium chloroacetimidivorans]